jgi:hypothetical protein
MVVISYNRSSTRIKVSVCTIEETVRVVVAVDDDDDDDSFCVHLQTAAMLIYFSPEWTDGFSGELHALKKRVSAFAFHPKDDFPQLIFSNC